MGCRIVASHPCLSAPISVANNQSLYPATLHELVHIILARQQNRGAVCKSLSLFIVTNVLKGNVDLVPGAECTSIRRLRI